MSVVTGGKQPFRSGLEAFLRFFCKKMPESICGSKKVRTFATAKPKGTASLGYGVMVTLQILVLSFLVRIQVAQHGKRNYLNGSSSFFVRIRGISIMWMVKETVWLTRRIRLLIPSLVRKQAWNLPHRKKLMNMATIIRPIGRIADWVWMMRGKSISIFLSR